MKSQYEFKPLIIREPNTIDSLVNEVKITRLHFKTMSNIALRNGFLAAVKYDLNGSFSSEYRRNLRDALKYVPSARYGC